MNIDAPTPLAVILGSHREGRLCDAVADAVMRLILRTRRFEIDVIDPLDLHLPDRLPAAPDTAVMNLRKRLARAQAFVVISPEYNHACPAPLKQIIDSAVDEWRVKPAALVGYGGVSGGLLAMQQLRLVLSALEVVVIRESLALPMAWNHLDERHRLVLPGPCLAPARRMLDRLAWWTHVLAGARRSSIDENDMTMTLRTVAATRRRRQPTSDPCSVSSKT